MSDEQLATLAFLAAGAVVTGYALIDRHVSRQVEPPILWYELTWPRTLEPESVVAFFRTIAGDRRRHVVALESIGAEGRLTYRLGLAEHRAAVVLASLCSFLPGVTTELIEYDVIPAPLVAWQLRLSTTHRALRSDDLVGIARAVVTALQNAGTRDTVVFQWLLGPGCHRSELAAMVSLRTRPGQRLSAKLCPAPGNSTLTGEAPSAKRSANLDFDQSAAWA